MKEIKLSPNIAPNDISYRVLQANKFLEKGDQVKVTLQFRGREKIHEDIGWKTMENFVALCTSGTPNKAKLITGRGKQIVTTLMPKKK